MDIEALPRVLIDALTIASHAYEDHYYSNSD